MIYEIAAKSSGTRRLMIIAVVLLFGCSHFSAVAEEARAPETVARSADEADKPPLSATPLTLKESLSPYSGPFETPEANDTLHGKVMAGYQGWFRAPEDGYGMGSFHWGGVRGTPPRCSVDFWPDLSEFDKDERFPTHYRHRDGRVAEVFSSTNKKTVVRHFRWMKEYGIDGVFVQRFGSGIGKPESARYRAACAVLNHCREGANRHGRVYAVMIDYYPVVFPGFSWSNLKKGGSKLNNIPRLGGKFLWSQVEEVREYGMDMIYVAMFDEVDEGTAIFKCTNDPPVGRFCTYEGYPSDYYLRICGQARILLRGGKAQLPNVKPDPEQMTYPNRIELQ